jgi:hypothetical protein
MGEQYGMFGGAKSFDDPAGEGCIHGEISLWGNQV